jgi:hypothetical protein
LIWFGEDPTSWRLRPRGLVVRSTDGSYEDWDAGDVDEARRTYAIRGLADGDYHLGIHYGEDRVWWYPGTLDAAGAGVLSIAGHADLAGIDWFCPRAYPGEVQ